MPLLSVLRFLFTLMSLVILATSAYLLWTWYDREVVDEAEGVVRQVREDWRLWVGLALLAWSFLGKFIWVPMLARGDTAPSLPERSNGQTIPGANGAELYVEVLGPDDAPPIVLTHGWSLDSTIWYYAKKALTRNFRVIVWDLPGLGRSKAASPELINLSEFAANLRFVMALAGNRPVVLAGHSIGGMTIQTLARDRPELFASQVAGVVLINTTYTNPLKTMILPNLMQGLRRPLLEPMMWLAIVLQPLAWLGAWQSYLSGSAHLANRFGFGRYVTRSQLEHTTLLGTRNPPGNIARGNLSMFNWDSGGAISQAEVPVLVIGGQVDIVTKPEAGRTIAEATPAAQLQVIDGVNHMGFLERADVYNQAIAEFASAVQPKPHPTGTATA